MLYNYGGIYLDTDYEIIHILNKYLDYKLFMGAEKENWLIGEISGYYDTHPFCLGNGKFDMIPNTMVLRDIMCSNGYTRGGSALLNSINVGDSIEFQPAGKSGSIKGKTMLRRIVDSTFGKSIEMKIKNLLK